MAVMMTLDDYDDYGDIHQTKMLQLQSRSCGVEGGADKKR
jgi:hypothetical protein